VGNWGQSPETAGIERDRRRKRTLTPFPHDAPPPRLGLDLPGGLRLLAAMPVERAILETARLVLDEFRQDDVAALAALHADPEVMRHIGSGVRAPARARAEAEAFLAAPRPGPLGRWAIRAKDTPGLMGMAMLGPLDGGEEIELGYRLRRRAWGCGIAAEAGHRLLAHAFEDLGLPRVVAVTSHANTASQRILVKLGFAFRKLVSVYGVDGVWYYDMSALSWPKVEAWRRRAGKSLSSFRPDDV